MAMSEQEVVALRQKILALKNDVIALTIDVMALDPVAARSMRNARASLFEAWTMLVGPPEEEEDDH